MKKPYKDIFNFVVKESKIEILGVFFMLSTVATDASADSYTDRSFESVNVIEKIKPVKAFCGSVDFELTDNQDKWDVVLDELSEYPDNWDAEGARAIDKATVDNCRLILKQTIKFEALLDDIFPTELGTVCIQWYDFSTDGMVNTEIAPDRMAFYADLPGKGFYSLPPVALGKEPIDKLVTALEDLS